MRICPCCEICGDVWEIEFVNLNGRRAVMCFECESVWETVDDVENQVLDTFKSIVQKHGLAYDWSEIKKLRRVLPEP